MAYYIKSKKIFKEDEILLDYALKIRNQKIVDFVKSSELSSEDEIINYEDKIIIPGMIDLHIHGAVGKDVMDADYEALNEISKYLAETGVTSFLATTLTAPLAKIKKALVNIDTTRKKGVEGAEILGAYLEGPYLTEEHKGAHPVQYMRELDLEEIEDLIKISNGSIRVLALAPEKNNSKKIIKFL